MEEKRLSFFEYEAEMTRMERAQKRLWIVIMSLLGVLGASNAAWMYFLFR